MLRRSGSWFVALPLLVACGGDGGGVAAPVDVVATISLSTPMTELAVRQEVEVTAEYRDARGRFLPQVAGTQWSSSDPAVVAVSEAGVVHAVGIGGPVTISASKDGGTGTLQLSVVPMLRFDRTVDVLAVDSVAQFQLMTTDFFGAELGVSPATWSTGDPAIARVDATGMVTGVGPGSTAVTATVMGQSFGALVEVGIHSPYDGMWIGHPFGAGSPFSQSAATLTVVFGEIRGFELQFAYVPPNRNASCMALFRLLTAVAAHAGSFSARMGATPPPPSLPTPVRPESEFDVAGEFVNGNTLAISIPELEFWRGLSTCQGAPGTAEELREVLVPAASFEAMREG